MIRNTRPPALSIRDAAFYALAAFLATILFQTLPRSISGGWATGWPKPFLVLLCRCYADSYQFNLSALLVDLALAMVIAASVYLQCRHHDDAAILTSRVFLPTSMVFVCVQFVLVADSDRITIWGSAALFAWAVMLVRQSLVVAARQLLMLTGYSFFFAISFPLFQSEQISSNVAFGSLLLLLLSVPVSAGILLLTAQVGQTLSSAAMRWWRATTHVRPGEAIGFGASEPSPQ